MSDEDESERSSDSEMEAFEENENASANPKSIIPVNNVEGLNSKLQVIKLNLDWVEKLDISTSMNQLEQVAKNEEDKAEHDFKRELAFINQAKSAAAKAILKLNKLGIPVQRPDDYFAEMAKSDEHMTKVRQKLLSKETALERSQKAKELREQRKNAKQMQREIMQKKQKEKKELMGALKKSKKGKLDMNEILGEQKKEKPQKAQKGKVESNRGSKKRKQKEMYKNEKYGYGGRKKRSKYNTADSSAFISGKGKSSGGMGKRSMQNSKRPRPKSTRRRR